MSRQLNILIVLLLVCVSLLAHADDESFVNGFVNYKNGLLSVNFNDVDLHQALQEISVSTGIRFSIKPGITGWISAEFIDYELGTAMQRLLSGYNTMFLHDKNSHNKKQLSRIMVLGKVSNTTISAAVPPTTLPLTTTTPTSTSVEIILKRHQSGSYIGSGAINGQSVEFLVDTGATTVAISGVLASKLKLPYGAAKTIETANGRTIGYETLLRQVVLDKLSLNNVRAIIMPNMAMGQRALLGMNFLQVFELVQRNGVLIIRQQDSG